MLSEFNLIFSACLFTEGFRVIYQAERLCGGRDSKALEKRFFVFSLPNVFVLCTKWSGLLEVRILKASKSRGWSYSQASVEGLHICSIRKGCSKAFEKEVVVFFLMVFPLLTNVIVSIAHLSAFPFTQGFLVTYQFERL